MTDDQKHDKDTAWHYKMQEEKIRAQWKYIQELEAKSTAYAKTEKELRELVEFKERHLIESEKLVVYLKEQIARAEEKAAYPEKRFLACFDELQVAKKAVAIVEDMLKTKSDVCVELCKQIAAMDRELNVLEKEREFNADS